MFKFVQGGIVIATAKNRSAVKREQLLAIATDLFLDRGYDGVSVDAIVQRAGGTKTNIYTYFGGKEGLFRAIIESLSQKLLGSLSLMDIADLCPREALTVFGRQFLSVVLQEKVVGLHRLAIAQSSQFPELGQIWHTAGPSMAYQELANYISKQQQLGKFKNCKPRLAASQFLYMLLNDIHLQLLLGFVSPPSSSEIKTLVDETVETFLHGITTD